MRRERSSTTAALVLTNREPKSETPRVWSLDNGALVSKVVHPGLTDGEQTAVNEGEVAAGAALLVDLTPEGKKAYGLAPK